MKVKTMSLVCGEPVPEDAGVVVIAGPRKPVDKKELASLSSYLGRGGRLLALADIDADKSFVRWLSNYGIVLGDNIIFNRGRYPLTVVVNEYPLHEITLPLKQYQTKFQLVRTVGLNDRARSTFKAWPLLLTGRNPNVWAESNVEAVFDGASIPTFNKEEADMPSPVFFGLAMEQMLPPRAQQKPARLVVVGDAEFAENRLYTRQSGERRVELAANGDLVRNAINWLAGQEKFISVKPKNFGIVPLQLEDRRSQVMWAVIAGIPFIFVVIGVMMYFSRRR